MSIRNDLIEECYEVIEAIDKQDALLLREELGDVLFQIYFHARLEEERGECSIDNIVNDICVKMIYRHPHVFGNVQAQDSAQVLQNWEILKKQEKHRNSVRDSMEAVPPMLPALMRAQKIAGKAIKDGWSFGTDAEIRAAMEDALRVVFCEDTEQTIQNDAIANLVFLAAVQSRKQNGDLESALQKKTTDFIQSYEVSE